MPMLTSLRPTIVRTIGNAARRLLALTLVFAIVFAVGPTAPLFAQAAAAAPMMLHITILDGEDSINDIRERTAREPIVQVEDENHKPVAGALILFSIQNGGTGAGGTFNGLTSLSVTTGADGRAVAHGLQPNKTEGEYAIAVTATLGVLVATAIIHQKNIAGGGGGAPPPPGTTLNPQNPATPVSPGTPGAPGLPVSPVTPGEPGTPASPTPSPAPGSSTPVTKVRKGIHHIPKKVWVTGTVIVIGTVVVIVATRGSSSTTITPGTGTVGP